MVVFDFIVENYLMMWVVSGFVIDVVLFIFVNFNVFVLSKKLSVKGLFILLSECMVENIGKVYWLFLLIVYWVMV